MSRGLRVLDRHVTYLDEQGGKKLEPKDAEALAKILASVNVIDRDRRKADKDDGPPVTPEEVAEKMAKAIGPDALEKAAKAYRKKHGGP